MQPEEITSTVRKYKVFQRHNASSSPSGVNYFHVNVAQVLLKRTEEVLLESVTRHDMKMEGTLQFGIVILGHTMIC
jgi:hypothetical protein